MKRAFLIISLVAMGVNSLTAQTPKSDPLAEGLAGVATVIAETKAPEPVKDSVGVAPGDSAATQAVALKPIPTWKKKLYYGYNFDIYYHHDTRNQVKENGWSISLEPEIGWKLKERIHLGLRLGGSYQSTFSTYSYEAEDGSKISEDLRIHQGSWNVTPYVRYRLKTIFNDKVGIWLEAHLFTGMEYPTITKTDGGRITNPAYDGLKNTVIYGAQLSPVITYQFNKKRTFQIFFSILSLGYSGTAFNYVDPLTGDRRTEYTNDVIVFSGKLRNLIANQFTPGLYGLKFGVQKSF